jgi:hypothetical protein
MPIASTPTQQPISAAAMKERRTRDAAQAMREYEAKRAAFVASTARLRSIRLAKEAETASSAPKKTSATKKAR